MSFPPIVLFDFDGVIITQKSLEYTALYHLRKKFYKWQNTKGTRLIDFARLFEESDSKNRLVAFYRINMVYKQLIPSIWRRNLFFIKFRRISSGVTGSCFSFRTVESFATTTTNVSPNFFASLK